MPLVVPGIMTGSGDKTEEWTNKLVGKKLSEDQTNEVVSVASPDDPKGIGNLDSTNVRNNRALQRGTSRKKPESSSPE